jgi:hypothetical protein
LVLLGTGEEYAGAVLTWSDNHQGPLFVRQLQRGSAFRRRVEPGDPNRLPASLAQHPRSAESALAPTERRAGGSDLPAPGAVPREAAALFAALHLHKLRKAIQIGWSGLLTSVRSARPKTKLLGLRRVPSPSAAGTNSDLESTMSGDAVGLLDRPAGPATIAL